MSTFEVKTQAEIDALSLDTSAKGRAYFNDTTGSIVAWDGAAWRAYISDGITGWPGGSSYSLSLAGDDDYASLSGVVTPSANSGTISAWVKTNTSAFMPIFSVSNNSSGVTNEWIVLQVDSSGKFEIASNRLGTVEIYESSSTINDNAWHHVMVTSSDSSYKLFLDGSEQTSASGNNTGTWIGDIGTKNASTVGAMRRGADTSNSYFSGSIDDVAIWDSDQSSNLSSIYGSSTPGSGTPSDLTSLYPNHWYTMGDNSAGQGTSMVDIGGSINATLVNSAVFQQSAP